MNIMIVNEKLVVNGVELPLEGYRVLDKLGTGASASVYLIYNKILDRKEALKIWVPRKGQNNVDKNRFYAEIRKNALFTGESSIATIYTANVIGNIFYCTMEYCSGVTLKEFLANDPSWLDRWGLAREISDTLESIYEKGIFHGDLHDKNIIIDNNKNDWMRILDLGTSAFSGKELSHIRDAQLLYELSFKLLPCIKDLAFYNDDSISKLPSPLLNKAFRAVINISNPRFAGDHAYILNIEDISREDYLPPDYHKLDTWRLVSMLQFTPVFCLQRIEQFIQDYEFGEHYRLSFYKELYAKIVGNEKNINIEAQLIQITTQKYETLSEEYKLKNNTILN